MFVGLRVTGLGGVAQSTLGCVEVWGPGWASIDFAMKGNLHLRPTTPNDDLIARLPMKL